MARCPRCFSKLSLNEWTNDPIKTPKAEAGEDYRGFIYLSPTHIEELQEARTQQEIDAGIAEGNRTTFTSVRVEGKRVYFYKKHLRELRESTEKILEATEQTKEDYFNYDEEDTEYNIGDHQLDWHDPDLDISEKIWIKAYHIEDLRHYIEIEEIEGVIETWQPASIKSYVEDDLIYGVAGWDINQLQEATAEIINESNHKLISSGSESKTAENDGDGVACSFVITTVPDVTLFENYVITPNTHIKLLCNGTVTSNIGYYGGRYILVIIHTKANETFYYKILYSLETGSASCSGIQDFSIKDDAWSGTIVNLTKVEGASSGNIDWVGLRVTVSAQGNEDDFLSVSYSVEWDNIKLYEA